MSTILDVWEAGKEFFSVGFGLGFLLGFGSMLYLVYKMEEPKAKDK